MDNLPDLNEKFPVLSYDDVKARVDEWLGGAATESRDTSKGTEVNTGSASTDTASKDVDAVFDELDDLG